MTPRDLIGKKCAVDLSDCCVEVHFVATLVSIDDEETMRNLMFDNGVLINHVEEHALTMVETD